MSDSVLVIYISRNELSFSRIGLAVAKRVGTAPVRNRWKRWMREAFRLNRHRLPRGFDMVIRPRKDAVGSYQAIEVSIVRLAKRGAAKLDKDR